MSEVNTQLAGFHYTRLRDLLKTVGQNLKVAVLLAKWMGSLLAKIKPPVEASGFYPRRSPLVLFGSGLAALVTVPGTLANATTKTRPL